MNRNREAKTRKIRINKYNNNFTHSIMNNTERQVHTGYSKCQQSGLNYVNFTSYFQFTFHRTNKHDFSIKLNTDLSLFDNLLTLEASLVHQNQVLRLFMEIIFYTLLIVHSVRQLWILKKKVGRKTLYI